MYDFKMLSDYDFELLVKDLMQRFLSCNLESFKKGRDKGIDLRYSCFKENEIVIQCKHYSNSSFSNLKSKLKREEYEKIVVINPSRYILVTSLGLTPVQKDELLEVLSPFCKSTSDILGMDDLNGLLREYPEVEKAHYKLWLTSSAVLEKIIHNDIYNRSEIALDIISTKLKLYVQNKAYYKALKILDQNNCCIISGIPGIGKTTLAEMLLITYLDKDYEVVKITQNINEAFNVYSSGKKQIFLYDDFLGQTGLELKLAKNEDQDILNFIRYVEKSSSSKFVLTTREYILNQAKSTYESLLRSNIDLKKCTLLLSDYTKHDKAKILFNHLYYQKLPMPYIENLLDHNVLTIVNHKNYNPRIIEIMTHNMLPQNPDKFYESFIMNLDNPNYIWKLAFENHISNEARDLLILLTSLPPKSEIENVEKVFNDYHSEKCKMYNRDFSDRDFRNALKELDGSFIQIDQNMISFHNPSINDFIKATILENDFEFKTLCETAVCFQQCIYLFNIARQTDYQMIDKYKDYFSAAVLENLLSFNIKFMYGNSINITGKYNYYNSVINRVIVVIKINDIIKSKSISDYLKDEFFPNLSANFEYYGGAISEYRDIIKLSQDSKYEDYFDIYLIKDIRNYVIEMILSNYAEEIDDFKFMLELEDIYPNLIDDYNKNQVSEIFSDFYHDDVSSVVDWGEVEAIDDYISTLEMLGKYFDIEVNDMVEYLEREKDEIQTFDEDSAYEQYRDNFIDEKVDDQMVYDMFDALLN